ncbi:hypothetical protein PsorP6_010984 [Peronosclerospora sorghi]|uniref:Uncharacterized protein n=1 Tax=Peronosclerospora sorghi TaxID=230839 RepID=A0ACC0VXW0_9STRA|nr:hypothetical protein PsorP6_010984 [Peronosclerospora sorghi]
MTGDLWRQKNLISQMKSKCLKFIDTRWLSMGRLLGWFVAKRIEIQQYIAQKKNPDCTPPTFWWIMIHILSSYVKTVNVSFVRLQGLAVLVSQQREVLKRMVMKLCEMCDAHGPLSEHELAIAPRPNIYRIVNYEVDFESAKKISETKGLMFTTAPVLPHEILKLSGQKFSHTIREQKLRLLETFTQRDLQQLEDEIAALVQARRREPQFKKVLDDCDHKPYFEKGWPVAWKRCPLLHTVESDFSESTWQKDEYRSSLTEFSLDGILQCKQHHHLGEICQRL